MKNKTVYTIATLGLCGGLLSCSDFLDTLPDNRTEINTADKVTNILVSAYPSISPIMIQELSSDNAKDNGNLYDVYGQLQQDAYLWRDVTVDDTDAPKNIWDSHYSAIASANMALQAIKEMGDPVSLSPQKGEALICRAYAHFQLANLFCMAYNPQTADTELGIPYITEPEHTVESDAERGTLKEVFEKCRRDIEEGLPLINDEIYSVPKYHFNKNAAYAFAARFYLYYMKYDKAIDCADKVLGADATGRVRNWQAFSQLATDYELRCNSYISHAESCNLLLQASTTLWPYIHGPYGIGLRYGNAQPIMTSEILPGPWGSAGSLYMTNGIWGFEQKYSLPKIIGYFEYSDKTAGIGFLHMVNPVFTTDELVLCRAEASLLKESPDIDRAMTDINVLLNSLAGITKTSEEIVTYYKNLRFMPTTLKSDSERAIKKRLHPQGITFADENVENMIQCVLHLRRVLTVHEGLRWNDIKRYGIEVTHTRDGLPDEVLTADDCRRAVQLPQEVITAGLQPNPRNK